MSLPGDEAEIITTTLSQLTIEEKVALLSGSSFVAATGVPRLGIPAINLVDSVNGVKGTSHINRIPTLCFPSTTCLGSTWNASLMKEMGAELAVQAKYKNASVILGPTVNIHRDPRGGRNFECFSEDPLLTGRLAAALINGIQSGGVAACPKHFVGNESETNRRLYVVEAEKRTLREIYLAAFQHLLRESTPMAIMTAYNKVDGVYCSESPIIKGILRDEWGFEGCVMSDWFGTRSKLPAFNAGLDLEMPGPSVFRGKQLVEDIKRGVVKEEVIDERVRRVLGLIHKTSTSHASDQERSIADERANSLARRVASEGIVLLKNENSLLPLKFEDGIKVAVIGAAAKDPPIGGGGSAKVPPQYIQGPLDCLRSAHLAPSHVSYSLGCKTHCTVPAISLELLSSAQVAMLGFIKPPLTQETFSCFIATTTIIPTSAGNHTLAVQATGAFEFFVDNKMVLSDDMQPPPSVEDFLFVPEALERIVSMSMEANKPYLLKAVVQPYVPAEDTGEPRVHAVKLCFQEEYSTSDMRSEAVQVASSSDVSIIFAGRNAEMESEGFDLRSIKLPSNQESLIQEVAKASNETVLVLYGGNPIDVSAYEHLVDAILFAHFPGQEGSQAIADILTGKTCPMATSQRRESVTENGRSGTPKDFVLGIEQKPTAMRLGTNLGMDCRTHGSGIAS